MLTFRPGFRMDCTRGTTTQSMETRAALRAWPLLWWAAVRMHERSCDIPVWAHGLRWKASTNMDIAPSLPADIGVEQDWEVVRRIANHKHGRSVGLQNGYTSSAHWQSRVLGLPGLGDSHERGPTTRTRHVAWQRRSSSGEGELHRRQRRCFEVGAAESWDSGDCLPETAAKQLHGWKT